MILYSSPLSPFSARVRFSLDYKAIAYDAIKPSALGGMGSPAFRAIAPLGRIPVLEVESGERIAESDVIVEFLEDAFRDRPLRPPEPLRAARARQIASIAELYIINRILWGGPGTRTPLAAMMPISGGRAPAPRDAQEVEREAAALGSALANIAGLLDASGPFALGRAPGVADGALVPYLSFARYAADYLDIAALRSDWMLNDFLEQATAADPELGRVRAGLIEAMSARRAEVAGKFGPLPG